MRKIVLLVLGVFLLSGCEAVYNVEITKDTVKDELIINGKNSKNPDIENYISYNYKEFNLPVDNTYSWYPEDCAPKEGFTYYNKELVDNKTLRFYYTFDINSYSKSQMFYQFQKHSITSDDIKFVMSSGEADGNRIFERYPYLDRLVVNIKTDYKVIDNDADEVNENTYTWYFTKSNYEKKTLYISLDKNAKYSKINDSEFSNTVFNIFFIVLGILVAGLLVFVSAKVKNSNK